jgi:hypothetical protein
VRQRTRYADLYSPSMGREVTHAWTDCSVFRQVEFGIKKLNHSRWSGGILGARLTARFAGQEGVGMTAAG